MSIRLTAKNDYSLLLNSLNTSVNGSSEGLKFLSDYASIKNGSYGKLMKAYYGAKPNSEVSSIAKTSTGKDSAKTLATVQNATDQLKESADALFIKGDKSVFKDDKITQDTYQAVSDFVSAYNSVLTATDKVNNTNILSRTLTLTNATASNKNLLEKVGITIKSDNSLSLDKDIFMAADISTVKGLFNTTGAFAYRVSAQSSLINYAADHEIAKANTYTVKGTFGYTNSTGNLFNSIF